MTIDSTYRCDGPDCHAASATAWITLRDHTSTDRHFCTWTCVRAFADQVTNILALAAGGASK